MTRRPLLIVDTLDVGGAERHVAELAGALRARGHGAAVACAADGPLRAALDGWRVPVHVLGAGPVKRRLDLGYAEAIRAVVGEVRPDIVHAHLHASVVAAAMALESSALPLVVTEHTEAPWRGSSDRRLSRLAFSRSSRILAVSTAIGDRLVEDHGVDRRRVAVVVPAIGEPPVRSAPPAAGHGTVVGFCGRLVGEKGVDVLLRAAHRLAAGHPRLRVVVIGDGPERSRLTALSASLGIAPRVRWLGWRLDVGELLPRLDVLAVPSRSDGSPLVVLEAMAAGVPVVGSAVGGLPDRIRDGQDGLLVPPDDPPALARALDVLLRDAAERRRLAGAGQARAAATSFAGMVDRILAAYDSGGRTAQAVVGSRFAPLPSCPDRRLAAPR